MDSLRPAHRQNSILFLQVLKQSGGSFACKCLGHICALRVARRNFIPVL